jgi:quinol monooxygenase YgiN
MYGTIARMKLKPGGAEKLGELMKEYEGITIPGSVMTYVYRMDKDPNEFYMSVVFEDKASYVKNADDPAQNERFIKMMEFLEGEPEWHDGEIVFQMK